MLNPFDINHLVDDFFYNTPLLYPDERNDQHMHRGEDGSVMLVQPGYGITHLPIAGNAIAKHVDGIERTLLADVEEFSIAVAGVGSSAIGTAAFAREVANTTGNPVLGLVTGDGMDSVYYTARTGCELQMINGLRVIPSSKIHVFKALKKDPAIATLHLLYSRIKARARIKLLAGHSRGNYVIEEALDYPPGASDKEKEIIDTPTVTFGAVAIFKRFKKVKQYIGDIDYFGMDNSTGLEFEKENGIAINNYEKVKNVFHRTNPSWGMAMCVPAQLQKANKDFNFIK